MMAERKKTATITYLSAFFIPVIIMTAVFAMQGVWPFGGNTVMTGDTTFQYVDYLSYYKTILFGNNDFSYSLSKNMGGEMAGFAAYYLFSPLNLLTLPFSKEWLFVGIALILVIAPGLASLSMYHALRSTEDKPGFDLVFSLCYGLSAYIVIYNELFQYYLNIILLPLILLWLREILKGRRGLYLRYILALGIAVINNYYTGYMICLFLVIYSVYYLLCEGTQIKEAMKAFICMAVNSLTGAGLACFTLIPAVLSLSGEKDNFSLGLFLMFSPWTLFSKLYSGSFQGDFGAGLPNIYCGIITSILMMLFLLNNRLGRRKRLLTGAVLLFFWIDFCINTLNVVWHGFNQPIGFPFRQAFLISAFCIFTIYDGLDISERYSGKAIAALCAVSAAYSILISIKKVDNTDMVSVIASAIVFVAIMILLSVKPDKWIRILLIVTIADLSFNAWYSLKHFDFTELEEFREPLARADNAIGYIKSLNDNSVYRIEKDFRRTNNDAMMYDYPGLTHFSSSEKKKTIGFMGDLGFRDNGNWAMYSSVNTALVDSILGVKYFASEFEDTGKPYDAIYYDTEKAISVFQNPTALPLMIPSQGSGVDMRVSEDPFVFQNDIADTMNGRDNNILRLQTAEETINEDGSVRYDLTVSGEGILYAYFDAPDIQDADIYLDGDQWGKYFGVYDWSVVDLLYRSNGERVTVEIKPSSDEKIQVDAGYFAVADNAALDTWYKSVMDGEIQLKKISSSHYKGIYDTEKENLIFSLPMDKGWHFFIEGKEYDLSEACGHLMSAEVIPGRHEVEMRFISPGRDIGFIISGLTAVFLLLYMVNDKRKNNHI
jgi:uncharacterized membrane protein YfhO